MNIQIRAKLFYWIMRKLGVEEGMRTPKKYYWITFLIMPICTLRMWIYDLDLLGNCKYELASNCLIIEGVPISIERACGFIQRLKNTDKISLDLVYDPHRNDIEVTLQTTYIGGHYKIESTFLPRKEK